MHSAPTSIHREKLRTNLINKFLFVVFIFMLFMVMMSDINYFHMHIVCASSIILVNFKDHCLDNSEDIGIYRTAHL